MTSREEVDPPCRLKRRVARLNKQELHLQSQWLGLAATANTSLEKSFAPNNLLKSKRKKGNQVRNRYEMSASIYTHENKRLSRQGKQQKKLLKPKRM